MLVALGLLTQLVIVGAAIRSRAATPLTNADIGLVIQAPSAVLRNRPTSFTLALTNSSSSTVPVEIAVFTDDAGVSVGTTPAGCVRYSMPPTIGFDCNYQLAPGSKAVVIPWMSTQTSTVTWQASVFPSSSMFSDPNFSNNFDNVDIPVVRPEDLLSSAGFVLDLGQGPMDATALALTATDRYLPVAPYRITSATMGVFEDLDVTIRLDSTPKGIATFQGVTPSQGCTVGPLLIHCVRALAAPTTSTVVYMADVGVTGEGTTFQQFEISADGRPPVFGAAEIVIQSTPLPPSVPFTVTLDTPSTAQGPYTNELNIFLMPPHTSVTATSTLTTNPTGGAVFGDVMTDPAAIVMMPAPNIFTFSLGQPATSTATQTTVAYEVTPLKAGIHNSQVVVSVDGGPRVSLTSAIKMVLATVTSVTASPTTVVKGQPVTFTATVTTPVPGAATPTGTVTFRDGATLLGTKTLSATGQATLTTSALTVGPHVISAQYGGTASFGTSSGTLTQTIDKAPTTLVVVGTPNPAVVGQAVSLKATVTVPLPGVGTPTGIVTFMDGATQLGTAPLNTARQATFMTTALGVGSHQITAEYAGDACCASSSAMVTQTINKPPTTTTLVSSANPAVFGRPVTFTATIKPTPPGVGTATGTVTFKDGATELGTVTLDGTGKAALTTSLLAVGAHAITAVYGGDTSFNTSTSTTLTETIGKAATSVAVTASGAQTVKGQPATFTATVNVTAPGAGLPTGTITFLDGATTLGTVSVDANRQASLTTSNLALGPHTITAKYSGDGSFTGSTSPAFTETITKVTTTTAVTPSVNPAVNGQSVLFTAQVTVVPPLTGTPTGTVTFLDGAVVLGTGPLDAGGQASWTTSALKVGAHTITARYNGDATFGGSTSTALSETINKAVTTTVVTSSLNPAIRGQKVTFTATVNVDAPATGLPTGLVTFKDGATVLGTGTLNAARQATLTTSAVPVGDRAITAVYAGNAIANTSTSPVLTETVSKASTKTTLVAPVTTAPVGRPLTFTATVDVLAPGAATPTGTVTFIVDGLTSLGAVPLTSARQATLVTGALPVGAHDVTARYDGNVDLNGSLSAVVNETISTSATTTTLTSNANPSVNGQLVTFSALVKAVAPSLGIPTGNVVFSDGTNTLGTVSLNSSQPAKLTIGTLAVGSYQITASYQGDGSYLPSTSLAVKEVVNKAATVTTLATSLTPAILAQGVTLTATVGAAVPGAGTPTGTVTFLDGATVLGAVPLSAGSASLAKSDWTLGSHTLTARYGGDSAFTGGVSASKVQTITKVQTLTSLVSSLEPIVHGQSVTFTASVGVVSPGTGTPTGTLTFLNGTAVLGTAPVDATGQGSWTTSILTTGPHAITARYGGDATYNGGVSAALTSTVNKAGTTTTLTSSANPAVRGQPVTFTATVDVSSPGTGVPTGTVTFLNGPTTLGTGVLNAARKATLTTSALAVNLHPITARYGGNTDLAVSTSDALTQTIGLAQSATTLTSSLNPTVVGRPIVLTATVNVLPPGAGVPTGPVTFMDGATTLGTVPLNAARQAMFTTSLMTVGDHPITASYGGNSIIATSTSAALTETVNKAATTTLLASSANPAVFGRSVTLTATVNVVAPGSGTPTGTVTFTEGATVLGSAPLDATRKATLTTSALAVGGHPIVASYGGDASFNSSGSAALTETITKAATATTVTGGPSGVLDFVTFTATVTVVAPGAGTPTGTVTFFDGAASLGTMPVDLAGQASLTTNTLSPGTHTIKARYDGDGSFSASVSAALIQVIPGSCDVLPGVSGICVPG